MLYTLRLFKTAHDPEPALCVALGLSPRDAVRSVWPTATLQGVDVSKHWTVWKTSDGYLVRCEETKEGGGT